MPLPTIHFFCLLCKMCPTCPCHAFSKWFYLFIQRKWVPMPAMHRPRAEAAVVAVNGQIYVMGGRDQKHGPTLDTMEIFDIKTGSWTEGPKLEIGRSQAGIVVLWFCIKFYGGNICSALQWANLLLSPDFVWVWTVFWHFCSQHLLWFLWRPGKM